MTRTQDSPKRRQEKQLSVCRKHWNHMQVTDRPSPDAPSLITGNSYGNGLLRSSVSTMQVNSDDLWTDIFDEIRWRYWSELFMKHSWRRWNLSGLSPQRKTKRAQQSRSHHYLFFTFNFFNFPGWLQVMIEMMKRISLTSDATDFGQNLKKSKKN